MKRWNDRVAVVTGAGSGIGEALARALAARGAVVWVTDRDEAAAASVATSIGERARSAVLDVTSAAAFDAVIALASERDGRVDALFNNAGVGVAGAFEDTTLEDWRRVFEVNLMGAVHGVRAVYPRLSAAGVGVIVNVASGAGLCPRPGMVAYAASKYAVVGLSTSLRGEAALRGVTVHAVCPGYIRTAIMDRTAYRGLDDRGLREAIPIQPMPAERCAELILRGVAKNRAVIPVTWAAALEWRLYRLAPWLVDRMAVARARAFARHRLED